MKWRPTTMNRRTVEVVLFIVLVVWAALFLRLGYSPGLMAGSDNCYYLMIARSFCEGEPYRDLGKPYPKNLNLCPSVLPLFLTTYWLFLEPHIAILKLVLSALMVLGAWMVYKWLGTMLPRHEAFCLALCFAASELFVRLGNTILTETLFVPLLYAGLFFAFRMEDSDSPQWYGWGAVASLVVLARTRAVGVPFFLVFVAMMLYRKRWSKAVVAVLLLAFWFVAEQMAAMPDNDSHGQLATVALKAPNLLVRPLEIFNFFLVSYRRSLGAFAGSMYANVLYPFFYHLVAMNKLKRLVVLAVFGTGCIGGVLLWRRDRRMRPAIVALAGAWLPIFTWKSSAMIFRYLFPFWPFLALMFLIPFHHLPSATPGRIRRYAPIAICVLLLVNHVLRTPAVVQPYPCRNDYAMLHGVITGAHRPPDVVLSVFDYYTYLKTGVPAIRFRGHGDLDTLAEQVSAGEVWRIMKDEWKHDGAGVRHVEPPLGREGEWLVHRVESIGPTLVDNSEGSR
jgi:hypothetical protein